MKNHLSDNAETSMTMINPPETQEMNTSENTENNDSAASQSSGNNTQTTLELQAVPNSVI